MSVFFCFLLLPALDLDSAECITLLGMDGKPHNYEELIQQPRVVVMIWTTWCHYCKEKLKEMECPEIEDSSARFYFINVGEKKNKVDSFLEQNKIAPCVAGSILLDKSGATAEKLKVSGVPAFVFFQQGKILYQSHYVSKNLLEEVFHEE